MKASKIIQYMGAGLLGLSSIAWLLTFPVLTQLGALFSSTPANSETWAVPEFFRTYPQIIWFSLVLGAGLWFFFGRTNVWGSSTPDKPSKREQNSFLQLIGQWNGRISPYVGIAGLALIMVVAVNLRVSDARDIGDINLIRSDYDEGVHASAALLMAQGKTIYKDYFLTQPPVGAFIWSIPLRLGRGEWGNLEDFLRLRLFTSILSVLTIATVYLIGRKLHSPAAGLVAAAVLAVDGTAVRTDQQIMLEPLINFFTALALLAFVFGITRFPVGGSSTPDSGKIGSRTPSYRVTSWYMLLAGVLAGVAFSIKVPAVAVVVGLALTLLIWRKWGGLLWFGGGSIIGWSIATVPFLITGGTDLIKQVYLYQLLRPFNNVSLTDKFEATTTLTAFTYMTTTPFIALTIILAGFGLLVLVGQWLIDKNSAAAIWLPVVLTAAFTLLLYTGKAGFFPHYYGNLALPLALLAGGVVTIWRRDWLNQAVGLGVVAVASLAILFISFPAVGKSLNEPSKPQWSVERATINSFNNLNLQKGTVFSWDARFTFIMGRPMSPDTQGDYFVDSAAAVEYLALGLEGKSLFGAVQQAVFDPKPGDLRFLRRTPLVQNELLSDATKADFVLIEARAESQLQPETLKDLKHDLINRLEDNLVDIYSSNKQISFKSGALFGQSLRLVGFDLAGSPKAGEKLGLTLYWRGEKAVSEDYTVFVHLLDKDGKTVAQRDTQPRYSALPTTKWEIGDLFDDNQTVDLPADLPNGNYTLVVGFYRPSDFYRLPITEQPEGQPLIDGNSLVLGQIEVAK